MAGLNFIQRFFVRRYLSNWKNRSHTKVISPNEEWAKAMAGKSFYIKRTYTYSSLCVDLYWYIKPNKKQRHVDYIYVRCAWEMVKEKINDVENEKLAQVIAESPAVK